MTGTWGAPSLPSGRDDFKTRQQPDPAPVDDLSRFVMDRIRFTENGPRSEVPQVYGQPNGPMVHRYASEMRADMVAFRRIVAAHLTMLEAAVDAAEKGEDPEMQRVLAGMVTGSLAGVQVIANRFSDHPDFKPEWRLE